MEFIELRQDVARHEADIQVLRAGQMTMTATLTKAVDTLERVSLLLAEQRGGRKSIRNAIASLVGILSILGMLYGAIHAAEVTHFFRQSILGMQNISSTTPVEAKYNLTSIPTLTWGSR